MTPTRTHAGLQLTHRLRRLRRSDAMRALVRETRVTPDTLMLPLFICEGQGVRREVASMPGVFNLSVDEAVKEVAAARADGIRGVLLFGLPDHKDDVGSSAYDPEAPVQTAVRALKREVSDVLVVTDVCLCEYTDHGHCGILIDNEIVNDPTVEQHAVDVGLAFALRIHDRRPVSDDLGHVDSLVAELVADHLAADVGAGNQHVETLEMPRCQECVRDGVRGVLGREEIDFQPVLGEALGGRWSDCAQFGPTERPKVQWRGQQPFHERLDGIGARKHDPVEASCFRARRIERRVVFRGNDSDHRRFDRFRPE
jgi:hypothetical protein